VSGALLRPAITSSSKLHSQLAGTENSTKVRYYTPNVFNLYSRETWRRRQQQPIHYRIKTYNTT
jgi:hypothetical protein